MPDLRAVNVLNILFPPIYFIYLLFILLFQIHFIVFFFITFSSFLFPLLISLKLFSCLHFYCLIISLSVICKTLWITLTCMKSGHLNVSRNSFSNLWFWRSRFMLTFNSHTVRNPSYTRRRLMQPDVKPVHYISKCPAVCWDWAPHSYHPS